MTEHQEIIQSILAERGVMMPPPEKVRASRPSVMEALKAIAARQEKAAPCAWCANVAAGDLTSTAIPKPSASQCAPHLELNRSWSRHFAKATETTESIMPSIVAAGIAVKAERRAA